MDFIVLDETHVWFNGAEITRYLRTGREPLALDGDRVVFAGTHEPWSLPAARNATQEDA